MNFFDLLSAYQQRQQQSGDYAGLLQAMFTGTPQDSVNITPRVGSFTPGSVSQLPPQAVAGAIGGVPPPVSQWQPPANIQPMGADNTALASRTGTYGGPAPPLMQGPQAEQLKSLFSGVSAATGMPLLSALTQQQIGAKAPMEVGKDSRLVIPDGQGGFKQVLGAATPELTPEQKANQTQGDYNTLDEGSDAIAKAMTPSDIGLGPNAPGLSWQQREAAQAEQQRKLHEASPAGKAEAAAAEAKARLPFEQQLADDRNAATEKRLADAAKIDLTDPGDKSYIESIANYKVRPPSAGRNPAQRKAIIEAALQLNPDYQEAKFDQSAKALRDFGTGKQGDIARSLDVSVAHLDTLRELGDALDNGDITLVNAAKQAFQEAFGVPAPTNFDAAKSIVADEVAKGVIGGQSAQADRETLAASLRKSGGPKVINGAIDKFETLLGGQLGGLRNQYKRTTGANDFDESFMSERTRKVLGGAKTQSSNAPNPKIDDLLKKYGPK